jgi:hypothetical protein
MGFMDKPTCIHEKRQNVLTSKGMLLGKAFGMMALRPVGNNGR